MSTQKYVSDIKTINHSQEIVYNHLSNFENLSTFVNNGLLSKINEQVPQIKIDNFNSDKDSCHFTISGMGEAELRITNREPLKTIKVTSSGKFPISLTFWIQLLPEGSGQSKLRLTMHAEMSAMIKMMVHKKLEQGIDQMADMLTTLPYPEE